MTNKTNDLILNLTSENVTQHSRIVTTTPTKMSDLTTQENVKNENGEKDIQTFGNFDAVKNFLEDHALKMVKMMKKIFRRLEILMQSRTF